MGHSSGTPKGLPLWPFSLPLPLGLLDIFVILLGDGSIRVKKLQALRS